jgi:hypothetical protein
MLNTLFFHEHVPQPPAKWKEMIGRFNVRDPVKCTPTPHPLPQMQLSFTCH